MSDKIEMNECPVFNNFFSQLQHKLDSEFTARFPTLPLAEFKITQGPKYIKIIRGSSVYAFINRENGDIMKPASFSTPAKHARGNINTENALDCCGQYGIDYMR